MTHKVFEGMRAALEEDCKAILSSKGKAYIRGSEDRLANFKLAARDLNMTPLQIWAVYFHKHIDAIMAYVNDGTESSEGIRSNVIDVRNYIELFLGLVQDCKAKTPIMEECDITCGTGESIGDIFVNAASSALKETLYGLEEDVAKAIGEPVHNSAPREDYISPRAG